MDAFEQLVSEILWNEGYWVRSSFKVNLSKEEKIEIGRPTSPRWELDILAYCAKINTVKVIECKSYLDSAGVVSSSFTDGSVGQKGKYKLFNDAKLREVVFNRLSSQLVEIGLCRPNPVIRLGLACDKISNETHRTVIINHFKFMDWDLLDEYWIRNGLYKLSMSSYENQMSSVVAKIIHRQK